MTEPTSFQLQALINRWRNMSIEEETTPEYNQIAYNDLVWPADAANQAFLQAANELEALLKGGNIS